MPLFKKKKEEKPAEKISESYELPELPPMPPMPVSEIKETAELPELPPMPTMVARAPATAAPTAPQAPAVVPVSITKEIEEKEKPFVEERKAERIEREKKVGPVYVKIDKYKDALTNFELIKKKLHETEVLLKKIKDTRAKEQTELELWEKELEDIKARIASIDARLFGALE